MFIGKIKPFISLKNILCVKACFLLDAFTFVNVGLTPACQINGILQNSCIAKLVVYSTLCVYIYIYIVCVHTYLVCTVALISVDSHKVFF